MDEKFDLLKVEINRLWEEHIAVRFPKGFAGKDTNGIDFVLLDSEIAGCVSTFIERGKLNLYQVAILGLRYLDANRVQQIINDEGKEYFWRLERLSELVLKAIVYKNHAEHLKN